MIGILNPDDYYLYGKLNQEVKTVHYKYTGLTTDTIVVTVDNGNLTIYANVVPATTAQIDEYL